MKKPAAAHFSRGRRTFIQTMSASAMAVGIGSCSTTTTAASGGNEPLAQDYTIAIRTPGANRREGYIYFNGFARLPGGAFIVSAVIDQPNDAMKDGVKGHQGRVLLSRSDDGGKTWKVLDNNLNFGIRTGGAALFVHEKSLYMFASPIGDDGIIRVSRSDDEGQTWRDFSEVIRVRRQPGTAATATARETTDDDANWAEGEKWLAYLQTSMVVKDGHLYFAVSERAQDMAIVSVDLAAGLLNKDAWKISPTVAVSIPKELNPGYFPGPSMSTLEGNVIEINGKLRLLARQVIDRYGTSNIASVFDIKLDEGIPELSFVQFFPIPGAHGLFDIVYDDRSRLFWMASNLESNSQNWVTSEADSHKGRDRRFMMLWYALDALNWFPAGCIAHAENMKQSFNYPSMIIDGDDLAIVARSAIDSENYNSHDADHVTFHRVRNFRSLALDIFPKP